MKLFCFGDSNTYGYDPRSPLGERYPAAYRWVDLLAEKLDCSVVNAGENGREIPRWPWQWEHFCRLTEKEAPVDFVILMLGTNDLLQGNSPAAAAGRMELFLTNMALDRSGILLVGPPPVQRGLWGDSEALVEASMDLNREYRVLSRRLGVRFADAGMWNIPLAFDGVHFTQEGHSVFAERLAEIINKGE